MRHLRVLGVGLALDWRWACALQELEGSKWWGCLDTPLKGQILEGLRC